MRYHWSLGIGHTYSHTTKVHSGLVDISREDSEAANASNIDIAAEAEDGMVIDTNGAENVEAIGGIEAELEDDAEDNPEFAMDDRENEDLGSDDGQEWDDERFNQSDHDDELYRTYHMSV